MTAETRDWFTDLMADAAWTRRLARALLGDASSGDDALQDAWMKARGKTPGELADRQGWVRTVLANALRNRRRGERRRLARERASAEPGLAAAEVATPEELLSRLEVQRTLAALVAGLAEPGRNVLLLHYYEGLTSVQIATATGEPPGTVRWRLKSAVDELRARLDAHCGAEKKDWRRALAPLLPAGALAGRGSAAPAPGAGPARLPVVLGFLLAGAVAVLLALLGDGHGPAGDGARVQAAAEAPGEPGPGERRPALAGGAAPPGGRVPLALAGAAVARGCDDRIRALEADLVSAREALAYHLPPQHAWAEAKESGQNPTAQRAIESAVARWLDEKGAPRTGRSIDCRADACVVKVLEPWPPTPSWVQRDPSAAAQGALEARARDILVEGAGKKNRPPPDVDQAETQVWLRLHLPSGAVARGAPLPIPRTLLPSAALRSDRPADEVALTAACRERKSALEGELEKLRRRSVSLLPAPRLFQAEPPNPALAATLQPALDRFVRARQALAEGERPPPLRAECRGNVCRVAAAEGATFRDTLLGPLLKDDGFGQHVRRSSARTTNGKLKDGLYVTILPPPAETSSGEDVLRHFLKQVGSDPAVELCKQKYPPSGSLTLRFVLPASGELNEDGIPERISFRLSGQVADTPHGRCLADALARRAATFTVPAGVSGAEVSKTVELPE